MFGSVLVVCVGNICRSPLGERLLRRYLDEDASSVGVASAGLGALVGHVADETASAVAAARGVSLDGHVARQFSAVLGTASDLILVMEPGHRREIIRLTPELGGRVMLFDQWTGARGIPDPYRRSREFHEQVFEQVDAAARAWAMRLEPGRESVR